MTMTGLEKARRARTKATKDRIWERVKTRQALDHCKCDLKRGMTLEQLRPLGSGCTHPRYICGALDLYRRELERL